ncbi:hypothetical protein [Cryobacterium melibiosiphilum]|uniref:hypothetical protein n=1 Tax=Cryobacterium melibiosiphilum TaxID=995039 RepID=UPI00366D5BF1
MTTEQVQELRDSVLTDAVKLADAREAYRGSGDVLDALWWRLHPFTPTPAGTPDPGAALPARQARVYARPCTATGGVAPTGAAGPVSTLAAAEQELRALEQRLALDAAALDSVVERMLAVATVGTGGGAAATDAQAAARDGAGVGAAARRGPPLTACSRGTSGRRWRRGLSVFALGAVVGSVCAALAATVAPWGAEPQAAADAASAPADTAVDATTAAALRIFTAATNWPDDAPPPLGAEYDPASIRSVLGAAPWSPGYGVYVAHRVGGDVCIIVQQNHRSVQTACTSPATLADRGLTVQASVATNAATNAEDGTATDATADAVLVTVDWRPDGSIVAQTSATETPAVTPYDLPAAPAPLGEFRS